jgi:hypothetical protein
MFSAVHPTTDIAKILRHARLVPEPDLSQTARRFAILANAAARDKPQSWLAAKISGAFSFARRRCLVVTGGRTGDAGIPRGEDQLGRHGGHPRLCARSGRKTVQGRFPAAARPARGADNPGGLRRWCAGAGGVRRGDARWTLRHRARPPRRTDTTAAYAQRRRDVRRAREFMRGPRDGICRVYLVRETAWLPLQATRLLRLRSHNRDRPRSHSNQVPSAANDAMATCGYGVFHFRIACSF